MQTTLAYAPTAEDLDEVFFDAPIITLSQPATTDIATDEAKGRPRPLSLAHPSAPRDAEP